MTEVYKFKAKGPRPTRRKSFEGVWDVRRYSQFRDLLTVPQPLPGAPQLANKTSLPDRDLLRNTATPRAGAAASLI